MNSNDLICKFQDCKLILKNPITMPCGNSICKHHLKQYEKSDQKFNCLLCKNEHEIPENRFNINKELDLSIQNYFNSDPIRTKIIKSLNKLSESVEEYNSIIPGVYINDYFSDIRNQVDFMNTF